MTDILDGRVVVVTGAGQGVGLGIAQVLAGHGATVAMTDIDLKRVEESAAKLRAEGAQAQAFAHDVSDPGNTRAVLTSILESFGRYDALVNNAGVATQCGFENVSEEDWDRITGINLRGAFFAAQAAGVYFKQRGEGGRIVNIGSFVSRKAVEEYIIYNVSKAGIVMMTETLALELGPHNVNVNSVCPGIVRTPIWDTLDPEQWTRQEQQVPLRRGQRPEDIGEAVAFLLSAAGSNITGASLPVTGGLAMW
ncbi:SDR family NAD(P)-dependent oxidoreductase [Nocardioides pelophilus]|uniref:SDR family NAD(P)-dependent oxidoreductase n=1 Tax=Nocardioides pelophilus TaxID=2172019 RepID=UPI0015FFA22E|nr:SDR family NAD(P)-dependent oxidoreductase [Nocardioides pelophilus]